MSDTGRPRASQRAYRIIAAPYNGWLWQDQFWTDEEWQRAERRRYYERLWKKLRRAARD